MLRCLLPDVQNDFTDTLFLPFLLLSILFLLYYRNRQIKQLDRVSAGLVRTGLFMVILSGIFLDLPSLQRSLHFL